MEMGHSNNTFLLAEDDENDVLLFQRALRNINPAIPLQVCRDGEEVIFYLKATGPFADRSKFPFPRALILDIKMPKTSGLEVLEWLHAHPQCNVIPKIVLTGSKEVSDVTRAYQMGANSYFVKPNSHSELERILRLAFDYWLNCEMPPLPAKCV
jgi:CheY-like chemotaxis protein